MLPPDPAALQQLFDGFPAIVYDLATDLSGPATYINAAIECLGFTRDEWCTTAGLWPARLHPGDRDRVLTRAADCVVSGESFNEVYRMTARDGSVRWFRDCGHVVRCDTGRPARWQGVMIDITDTGHELEALRTSEAHHRERIDLAAEGIVVLEPDGAILVANSRACRLLGYNAGECEGLSITAVLDAEELAHHPLRFDDITLGMPVVSTRRLRRRDGGFIEAELSSNLLPDGNIQSIFRDISERRQAERERERLLADLEFERRRLVELFDQTPAFVAVLRGPDHVFERVNAAYERLVSGRTLIGQRVADAVPEIADQGFVAVLDRVFATGTPFTGTGVCVALRQTPGAPLEDRYLDFVYQPIVEADGSTSGILVHGVDVTERIRAAALHEENERRLRAQFEHIPMPTHLWRLDDDGETFVLADYNAAAVSASHGLIRGAIGRTAWETFPGVDGLQADMLRALRDQVVIRRDIELAMRSVDETRAFSLTIGPVQPDRVIVHAQDTTEQRRLEQQFLQSQKLEAVGRLAGGVAHDFNNLLTVIRGHAEFMRRADPGTLAWHDDLAEIISAVTRASTLTRQLLAYSRKQVLQPRLLDLNDVIAGIVAMVQRLIGEDIAIDLRLAPNLGMVRADRGQMEQVLVNLAVNSRDAMPMGGRLTIATENAELPALARADGVDMPAGMYATISITDTGFGIDDATRAHVFEPFFTTKEPGRGTGLGLSTVYGIVTQSGGGVVLDSEPGRGTTVRFYLPLTTSTPGIQANGWDGSSA